MESSEETPLLVSSPGSLKSSSRSGFVATILPFLFLEASVGLCASLQATFYPIQAELKGATAAQFGAVFGIIHISLFIFGKISIKGAQIYGKIFHSHTTICSTQSAVVVVGNSDVTMSFLSSPF